MNVRKTIARIGIALGLAVVLFTPWLPPKPFATGPTWLDVDATSARFFQVSAGSEQWGLEVFEGDRMVFREVETDARQGHRFTVDGLAPGRGYTWRLTEPDGSRVDEGRLRTRSDDDRAVVRFAVLGDSGDQPFWRDLADAPATRALVGVGLLPEVHPDPLAVGRQLVDLAPTFWLHAGDVIYPRGELADYPRGFFRPFEEALRTAPCYPVAGNHDLMVGDGLGFDTVFRRPDAREASRDWSLRAGPLRVVGLDTNREFTADSPGLAFLRAAAAHGEPWLILISHYPMHSVYRAAPRPDLERHLWPLCRDLGVDLVFAGHDHLYQRFGEPGDGLPVEVGTGGGGKDLYEIHSRPERLAVTESVHHLCVVEVDGAELRCEALAVDGRQIDRFVLTKNDEGSPGGSDERARRVRALLR